MTRGTRSFSARAYYAGRSHRNHDTKHEIRILDYVDHEIPVCDACTAKRQAPTPLTYGRPALSR